MGGMAMMQRFFGGMRALFSKRRTEGELDEELRGFVEMSAADKVRNGMTPDQALRAARVEQGGLEAVKEEVRDAGWEMSLERLWQDLHYAGRFLRKNLGFTMAAVLTLALAIGANTAIFSVVNAVLLKPLPYPSPERLVAYKGGHSFPDIADMAEQAKSLTAVGCYASWALDLNGQGEPLRVDAALIGGDIFDVLGVPAFVGRTFSEKDDRALAPVVVVSYEFWQTHLQGDRAALGRTITLSGNPYTIIGVMPAGFRLPTGKAQLWMPFRVGYAEAVNARGAHFTSAIGRLRDGVSLSQAQSEVTAIGKRLAELYPEYARTFTLLPLQDRVVGDIRTPLLVLLGAVALVLLIACSNFAGLLLARMVARSQEMQVRSALGASRFRLVRQLLTESAFVSVIGGLVGVAIAIYGVDLLLSLKPEGLPSLHRITVDTTTLGFAFAVSLLTGIVFGTAPALQVWHSARQTAGARVIGRRSQLWRALVISEIALSVVLLAGAGLLIRSFWRLQNVPLGFNPEGLLTLELTLPISRYKEIPPQEAFLARLDQELRTIPGAQGSALSTELPLDGSQMMHRMIVEGQPETAPGHEPQIFTHEISPGYF